MKVLEEEPAPEPSTHKQKTKSQNFSREELTKKVNELIKQLDEIENEKDKVISERERDKDDFNRKMKEARAKADAEIQELKKTLQERDEVILASTKRIKSLEKEVEETGQKLSSKEVEALTMELEIEEYKSKIPEMLAKEAKDKRAQEEKLQKEKLTNSGLVRDLSSDITKKNAELQDMAKQKQEIEKSVKEAQAKLTELEGQILKKVMSTPTPNGDPAMEQNKDKQIDMLKKQLGEEVFERRRLENEIREMKRMCVDMENLKSEKNRLEAEIATKADLDSKLSKINIILQGLINKDDSTLTVGSIKDVLTKVRKGISTPASSPTPGSNSGSVSGSTMNINTTPPESRRPKTMTMSFYNKDA